ncbi:ABC-type transport auxiliary lipoprotein family protein [Paucibacter sp. Y2R2-4]|uniref:ABC-type transport auxiliary lipoprotein family protein n=1 Tax=Paucibacter sp. Y2R2-4 TaxID=2893553 RepID=UPI0021E4D9A1|nr:ABC-type transport auxiliary lipoprotein family protein [Paucibacter sp. Y2R2-4]MCV2352266.1 ABC-type transport auxiliary lipoprotein family protein [Paucibacter sp. Y2R2-4]
MNSIPFAKACRTVCGASLLALGACGSLLPTPPLPPALHLLSAAPLAKRQQLAAPRPAGLPSLHINAAQSAAGYDSRRIIYLREPNRLDYYARHEWVDTPARMLAPLLLAAMEASGRYRVVMAAPSAALAEYSLDSEVIRLQQDFSQSPSQVLLVLRLSLMERQSRRVLVSRVFESRCAAASEDAAGGVNAAAVALTQILNELADATDFAPLPSSSPRP